MTQLSIKISFLNKLGKGAQSGACDDLEEWDRGGKGGELKREGVCVCVCVCVYVCVCGAAKGARGSNGLGVRD